MDLLDELAWRGLLQDTTEPEALRAHLAGGRRRGYIGFDPTADSLTIGHFLQITLLTHLARAGHTPVALMGGGTGMIGDPSFRDDERPLLTVERIEANVAGQRAIVERLLGEDAIVLNNIDWLGKLGYIEALRDIGKHFSVNEMIRRESVKARLEGREQGISYTEFSYALLQSYDFLRLLLDHDVTIQLGGSDQWGNIVAGIDLVRRVARAEVHGVTSPLITRADGQKMGKSETGAIWLSADRTSPYAFFQYWLNYGDKAVGEHLKVFTFRTAEDVDAVMAEHARSPELRHAQRTLARDVTTRVHGADAARRAEEAADALFSDDVRSLDEAMLGEVFAEVPSSEHDRGALDGEGADPVALLVQTGLAKSNREAREHLTNGSVSVNGDRIGPDDRLRPEHLLHGTTMLLRRGKKAWHVTRWR